MDKAALFVDLDSTEMSFRIYFAAALSCSVFVFCAVCLSVLFVFSMSWWILPFLR